MRFGPLTQPPHARALHPSRTLCFARLRSAPSCACTLHLHMAGGAERLLPPALAAALRRAPAAHPSPPAPPEHLAGIPGLQGSGVSWAAPAVLPLAEERRSSSHGDESAGVVVRHKRGARAEVAVCQGKSCRKAGSAALLEAFRSRSAGYDDVVVRTCKCRDECKKAPVVQVSSPKGRRLVKARAVCCARRASVYGSLRRAGSGAAASVCACADASHRCAQHVHRSDVAHILAESFGAPPPRGVSSGGDDDLSDEVGAIEDAAELTP